jgi:hypothetical protein
LQSINHYHSQKFFHCLKKVPIWIPLSFLLHAKLKAIIISLAKLRLIILFVMAKLLKMLKHLPLLMNSLMGYLQEAPFRLFGFGALALKFAPIITLVVPTIAPIIMNQPAFPIAVIAALIIPKMVLILLVFIG